MVGLTIKRVEWIKKVWRFKLLQPIQLDSAVCAVYFLKLILPVPVWFSSAYFSLTFKPVEIFEQDFSNCVVDLNTLVMHFVQLNHSS